ncbi:MAG TPA: glycosyltransferase family 4 protein, partial [Thermoanaerobaculia bacterium]|nr:glycosyltransferase family 4 protein [Thermoanaerobaculia bacterium]
VPELSPDAIGPADVAIGTMWRTVPLAERIPGAIAGHLCQCYEGIYEPIRDLWPEIERVYRSSTLKLAVSPHLVALIERKFGQRCFYVPQPFDAGVFHPPSEEPGGDPFRVLVAGPWDLDIKGVAWVIERLQALAGETPRIELVRLALDAPPEELAAWPDAERHLAVPPSAVPAIMRSVDLYVSASSPVEGFGLPALEAMGCGRPTLLSDIPAYRSLDPGTRTGLRFTLGSEREFLGALRRLRDNIGLRRRLGAGGRAVAEGFSYQRTTAALIEALETVDPTLAASIP